MQIGFGIDAVRRYPFSTGHLPAVTLALVALVALSQTLRTTVPVADLVVIMAVLAVAAGAVAAVLSHIAAQLDADPRSGWIGVALAVYSVVAIPTATLGTAVHSAPEAIGAARLTAHSLVIGATVLVAVGPRLPQPRRAPWIVVAGLTLTLAAAVLGAAFPAAAQAVTTGQFLRYVLGATWIAAGLAVVAVGLRSDLRALSLVGLGSTLLGVAHTVRVTDVSPVAELGLPFSTLRLLGVVVTVFGAVELLRSAVRRLDELRAQRARELRTAVRSLDRVVERDHELRTGLAGLARATSLLTADRTDDARLLGSAVAKELTRLDALLEARVDVSCVRYNVIPVLRQQIALRAPTGMTVRLEHDGPLWATGSPDGLAQVVANVLQNAARHAPGSPVEICAFDGGDRTVVEIRDRGPGVSGVSGGSGNAVFEPGVRREHSPGRGLGLHICRQLLRAAGGEIEIRGRDDGRGCVVVVSLPTAGGAYATVNAAAAVPAPKSGGAPSGDRRR